MVKGDELVAWFAEILFKILLAPKHFARTPVSEFCAIARGKETGVLFEIQCDAQVFCENPGF